MTTSTLTPLVAAADVLTWRVEQLLAAGYPETKALRLAERADIDLHLATRLLADGCPPDTALRILL